ncbi:hypothetical protein [Streptomyces olivaceoviridis]
MTTDSPKPQPGVDFEDSDADMYDDTSPSLLDNAGFLAAQVPTVRGAAVYAPSVPG